MADTVIEYAKNILIDRYLIDMLTEFEITHQFNISNNTKKSFYVKMLIEENSGNWTFDDGTTAKNLGSIGAFGTTTFTVTIKRPVPASDVEDDVIPITFELYSDSGYTKRITRFEKEVIVDIVDIRTNPTWNKTIWDFDDGTLQGWTVGGISGWGVSNAVSIKAGGYGIYKYQYGAYGTWYPYLEKTISVPNGVTKAYLIFYYCGRAWSTKSGWWVRLSYVNVYINGVKVIEDKVWQEANNNTKVFGWFQQSVDLSDYQGQDITVKIELEIQNSASFNTGIYFAVDDVILASK